MNKKALIIMLSFVFIHLSIFAQDTFKPGSEPTGFQNMRWGMPLSSFSSMNLIKSTPGDVTFKKIYPDQGPNPSGIPFPGESYVNKNDMLQVEGVRVDEINYIFQDNKFSGMLITANGYETFEKLKKALFKKYGEAKFDAPSGSYFDGCMWRGNKTEVTLLFGVGNVVMLEISSVEMKNEMKKATRMRRGPVTAEVKMYGYNVWAISSSVWSPAAKVNLRTLQERINYCKDAEKIMEKYSSSQWKSICDRQIAIAGNPAGRSDKSGCNAAGALYFEDKSFCQKLPDIKLFKHEPSLRTKCITAVAIKSKNKSYCNSTGIDSDYCGIRFNKEFNN